jgi:hypothetical protein
MTDSGYCRSDISDRLAFSGKTTMPTQFSKNEVALWQPRSSCDLSESEIFLRAGLDRQIGDLPVGQISGLHR